MPPPWPVALSPQKIAHRKIVVVKRYLLDGRAPFDSYFATLVLSISDWLLHKLTDQDFPAALREGSVQIKCFLPSRKAKKRR